MRSHRTAVLTVGIVLAGLIAASISSSGSRPDPSARYVAATIAVPEAGPGDPPDPLAAYEAAIEAFVHDQQRQVDEYLAWQHAQDLEAERQRQTTQRQRPSTAPSSVGECSGFPIPDYIIQRESGGNPWAQNPSGAFGCTQIMPFWWTGPCSGLDRTVVADQIACTQIILDTQGISAWKETA
ncbi:MAG TPA: lytic transglycosylase domain-containing protein [Solirubrobacterales bacterium]